MKDIMKALVYTKADGIHLTDVPTPKIEKNTDVIIRVDLSTICGTDIHIANGLLPVEDGTIIGHEFVGTIAEAAGFSGTKSMDARLNMYVHRTQTTACLKYLTMWM